MTSKCFVLRLLVACRVLMFSTSFNITGCELGLNRLRWQRKTKKDAVRTCTRYLSAYRYHMNLARGSSKSLRLPETR